MAWTQLPETIFMCVYIGAMAMVCLYGLHRYGLVFLYFKHRRNCVACPDQFDELPRVTIQLPMYNEELVARRIIEHACRIEYPRDKLDIQVLDDSTDQTCRIARKAVDEARRAGFDITYISRENRTGYKAGALANGLATAKGEFVAIFDADFVPTPEILLKSIPYFKDPEICVVQTRWEHLNRSDSLLTQSQAILLDGHFAIEHVARNRSARFMSFNGTAGTWRRSAIDDAGGWQHDTLTEDLDLSFRAQLKGWKFIFLPDLTAPAELPSEMDAFKAQQFRWTKGGVQTALKLLPKVMLSKVPLKVKVEAFFHLTCFSMHMYMLALVVMMFPAIILQSGPAEANSVMVGMVHVGIFTLATLSATVFYVASQVVLFGDWRTAFKLMPMMMALGVGLCVSNTKAIAEAIFGKQSEFVRTPKYGDFSSDADIRQQSSPSRSGSVVGLLPVIEFILGVYMAICAIFSLVDFRSVLSAPFLVMFSFGFFYVSLQSGQATRRTPANTGPQGTLAPQKARA